MNWEDFYYLFIYMQANSFCYSFWELKFIWNELFFKFQLGGCEWKSGCMSGAVYNFNVDANKLFTDVYGLSALTNPLHPDVFPGIRKMEAEVIEMCVDMFHGGPDACGAVTFKRNSLTKINYLLTIDIDEIRCHPEERNRFCWPSRHTETTLAKLKELNIQKLYVLHLLMPLLSKHLRYFGKKK